ncbi:MAG: hypothetical protein K0S09_2690 [Sphingobacteriaceae bacterium]|jgi:hypothetical protein|nr:hypothetical protein [Sphingobacteriaceae bacterium]
MNFPDLLTDIFKYSISGLIVFFVVFYVLKSYIDEARSLKLIELKKASQAHTLPLRLQAYERMILFLERINPSNMLVRLHVSGISAREMHNMLLSDIRAEYQHNTAQQLYVSSRSWAVVKKLKEDSVAMINNVSAIMPEHASSVDLSKAILNQLATVEENPYDSAIALIKRDIEVLF